jgi:hypothetical protein
VALRTMLERISSPWLPPRTITLAATLQARLSTAAVAAPAHLN